MLAIRTPDQTTEYQQKLAEERSGTPEGISIADEEGVVLALSGRIDKDWQAAKSNKTTVEHNMLECLRERKGEYGPKEAQLIEETGGSDIYIPLATAKVRAGIAHTKAILLPAGAKAYGISPTKNPSLPVFMQQLISERITSNPNMVDDQGQPVDPMKQVELMEEMARKELAAMSKTAAREMERKITDQLQEGNWRGAMSDYIDDLFTYPAAFMKGPYFSMEPVLKWERTMTGMKPVQTVEKKAMFRTINPFDAYPAPGVDSVHKGPFIERLRLSRSELYRMRKMAGYNETAILSVMEDHTGKRLENWLWTDAARHSIADHNFFWYTSTTDFDGLHWFGRAQGTELIEWGMDKSMIPDPLDEYEVDAIKIGRHVVRAALNPDPLYRRVVHSTSFEKVPGSVFGNSPSMLMRNTQRMVNATARALQNNLAHASGFQAEVDYTRVAAETDIHDIYPFKVWQARESENAGDRPAVRFFQPDSNADELIRVIDYFKAMADNDTGIPELFQGTSTGDGASATARGQALLADQGSKLLRSSISNVDEDIAVPCLEMLYDHNMLYDEDDAIKGDSQVVAKGANAMLQRESSRQSTMAMLEVLNNPTDLDLMGLEARAYLVKHLVQSYEDIDQDQVMPGDETLEQRIAEIKNRPPPPDPAMAKVEMTGQIEQQKMQMEAKRIEIEEALKAGQAEHERMIKQMELASEERVARSKLDKEIQDEVVKLRATRMSERERMQIEVLKEKMKAETQIRSQVENIKAEKVARAETPAEAELTEQDIRAAVEAEVSQMASVLQSDIGEIVKTIDDMTVMMAKENDVPTEPSTPHVINVNIDMPEGKPVTKTIKTTRDASGNLTGTVTPS